MKLVKNAKRIAWRSYSLWANYLGIAALIAPEAIYTIWQIDTNPRIWWFLGIGLIVFGIIGRLVDQGMTRSPALVMAAALFLAMAQVPERAPDQIVAQPFYGEQDIMDIAVPLVRKWEGAHRCNDDPSMHCAYLDTIAEPDVWTACHGETKGITRGMRFTDAQCRDMLAREVRDYWKGWRAYTTDTAPLHAPREAAFTSLAYNVGIAGAGRSTATKRLNAGNVAGACQALTWWNRAGQRIVRGLVNRRADEYTLCMVGA